MKYDLFTVPCPKLNDCTSLWADSLISVKPTETENVEIVFPSMTKCDLGVWQWNRLRVADLIAGTFWDKYKYQKHEKWNTFELNLVKMLV